MTEMPWLTKFWTQTVSMCVEQLLARWSRMNLLVQSTSNCEITLTPLHRKPLDPLPLFLTFITINIIILHLILNVMTTLMRNFLKEVRTSLYHFLPPQKLMTSIWTLTSYFLVVVANGVNMWPSGRNTMMIILWDILNLTKYLTHDSMWWILRIVLRLS